MLVRGASALGIPSYLFSFDVTPGAHTQDLDYVFDVDVTSRSFPDEAPQPPLRSVVLAMQAYWLAFAETGEPTPPRGDLPFWPRYDLAGAQHLSIAEPPVVKSGLSDADCDLWSELFAADLP
jgi:carboxylesterase type B